MSEHKEIQTQMIEYSKYFTLALKNVVSLPDIFDDLLNMEHLSISTKLKLVDKIIKRTSIP